MSSDVTKEMKIAETKGLDQSIKFREERIVQMSKLFYDHISKNNSSFLNQVQVCKPVSNLPKKYPV